MQVYILCIESICTNNDIFNVLGSPTKLKTVDLKVAKKIGGQYRGRTHLYVIVEIQPKLYFSVGITWNVHMSRLHCQGVRNFYVFIFTNRYVIIDTMFKEILRVSLTNC